MTDLLLDTCTVIWMGTGESIGEEAANQINESYRKGRKICISPISAWELGVLVAKEHVRLERSVLDWFEAFATQDGIDVTTLSPSILVNSWALPGKPPKDPADRIIISTARALNLAIVTRDLSILNYSNEGHVHAIYC